MKRVEVQWVDTLGSSGWEKVEQKLADMVPSALVHRSLGWVLRDDEAGLVIASSLNESESGPWKDNVADATFIPRQAVVKIEEL